MSSLLILVLLFVGAAQEWAITVRVYEWLTASQPASLAFLEILLSFGLSAALGVKLVKRVGVQLLRRAQQQLASGQALDRTLAAGVLLLLSAFLFIVPGYLSDAAALVLLLIRGPLSRLLAHLARKRLAHARIHVQGFGQGGFAWESGRDRTAPVQPRRLAHDPLVIDVEAREEKN